MCGIAGILSTNSADVTHERLKKMTDIISHRGPDGEGHWISGSGQVGLGHRRLSIIDLSHEADQPMHYLNRYTIVFNGEIYNYIELKEMLLKQGYQFKTQSDTEVLMALYDRDKENCLQLLDGMFAFVIYDQQENAAFCARDRFGEKPFFYSHVPGKHFLFGSEMKCLWAGGIDKEINDPMMFNYLSFGYIENPKDLSETFFRNCTRLEHGHFIKIDVPSMRLDIKRYYDVSWQQVNPVITVEQAQHQFRELFYTSVQRRLRSDVTVGSSLSGGLDSSLVVCVIDELRKGGDQKQNTFSAVFPGFKKDERKYMDYVLAKTKVEPHFVTPNDDGLKNDIDKLSWHQEEPFGSASIYAQYCVMKLAKDNHTTVLLDGQGADEILAGYHSYYKPFFNGIKHSPAYKYQLEKYNQLHSTNPINGIAKKSLGDIVRSISPALVKPGLRIKNIYKQTFSPVLDRDFYHQNKNSVFETSGNNFSSLNEMLHSNTMQFGLQQLLRYADRNSMAHSREVRLPFLSHELVDFLFTLPETFKINEGWTKWIMRTTFENLLPREIAWRVDKIGYEPPQKNWMDSAEMRDKIFSNKEQLVKHHFLNPKTLKMNYENDSAMNVNNKNWNILMAGNLLS